MKLEDNIVALVDCNNFFASCERAFNPKLMGKPIVVLSNNDGCIVARSNEAKALGIPMGSPLYKMQELIDKHKVFVFSSNYVLYGDMSRRVMEILSGFTPEIEIYSIDEAFLNFSRLSVGDLTEYGKTIRDKVVSWTGLPVSVGIARTKTLAKLASRLSKKIPEFAGVLDLSENKNIDKYLEMTQIEDIWGVGRRIAPVLRAFSIGNARQLRDADDRWIKQKFSVLTLRTVFELRGTPCIEIDSSPPPKKSIVCSRSFGEPIVELASMKEAVASYISKAALKLRKQKSVANGLTVFLMTNRFDETNNYHNSATAVLPAPTAYTPELLRHAEKLAESIFRDGYSYKKAGVMLFGISPESVAGNTLFTDLDYEKNEAMMKALDEINKKYGRASLGFAAVGQKAQWSGKSENRSPHYTTDWNDILKIGEAKS